MTHARRFRDTQVPCPVCGAASPRISLLTSLVVYLECRACERRWTLPATHGGTERRTRSAEPRATADHEASR